MPVLSAPRVDTAALVTSTLPVDATARMPTAPLPVVDTELLVIETPPAGPSAAPAPGGAIGAGAAVCWPRMPAALSPVVRTLPEAIVTERVPNPQMPRAAKPLVETEVLPIETSPLMLR